MSGPLRKAASLDDRTLLEASLAGQYGEVEEGAIEDALIRAASNGNTECVSTLLQHGADPDARDMDGDTPLMVAVANGHTDVVELLLDEGADMDATSDRGRTALHMAAWNNRYEIARMLLLAECDVNVRECYGDTPVMLAARRGHTDVLRLLLEYGCPHDACSDELDTALHYAARYGRPDCVKLLLADSPQDVDMRNIWGVTPLLYAAQFCQTDCARALLAARADVQAADSAQRSVLHHACKKRNVECVKLLLRHGAVMDVSDQDATTPLMDAISVNCPGAVLALIQCGCNVDVVGKATVRGAYVWTTPFLASLKNDHFTCANMLYCAGCPLGPPLPADDNEIQAQNSPHARRQFTRSQLQRQRRTEDVMEHSEEWVTDIYRVPRSLSIWCRVVIHKQLGRNASSKVKRLPLPKGLQLFVAYYDLALLISET